MERKLGGEDVKASLGDYIRLMQLHKELDEDAPREIKVTWVEPKETREPVRAEAKSEPATISEPETTFEPETKSGNGG